MLCKGSDTFEFPSSHDVCSDHATFITVGPEDAQVGPVIISLETGTKKKMFRVLIRNKDVRLPLASFSSLLHCVYLCLWGGCVGGCCVTCFLRPLIISLESSAEKKMLCAWVVMM